MDLKKVKSLALANNMVRNHAEGLYGAVPYHLGRGRALPPLAATFLLTYRCNCRCVMCFYYNRNEKEATLRTIEERSGEELRHEEMLGVIDDLAASGVKVVSLHGGEPLLHPAFLDVTERAVEQRLVARVFTNGALMTPGIAERLCRVGVESVTFSIDGTRDIHDRIRGAGTYEKAVKGVRAVLEAKRETASAMPHLNVSTYVTSLNVTQLPDLVEVLDGLGFEHVSVTLASHYPEDAAAAAAAMVGAGNLYQKAGVGGLVLPSELASIDPGVLKDSLDKVCRRASRLGIDLSVPSPEAIEQVNNPSFNESSCCTLPWTRVTISPYGEVFSCVTFGTLGLVLGNLREDRLKDIWNNPRARSFRVILKRARTMPVCSKCCSINPGRPC